MGLLDIDRQATQARLTRDVGRSKYGMLNDDNPIQKSTYGGMYGSLMQDPANKERMDREMWQNTVAMMPIAGMNVYHGSPHIFNKFRMDKIGTGEGVQAYGHGLYLAQNPKVAKEYQDVLGKGETTIDGKIYSGNRYVDTDVGGLLDKYKGDVKKSIGEADTQIEHLNELIKKKSVYETERPDWAPKLSEMLKGFESTKKELTGLLGKKSYFQRGHLYKVDLPDDQIKNMLDYDVLVREQPKVVRDALELVYQGNNPSMGLGQNAYAKLSKILGGEDKASAYLNSKGIPGIKYLDQGSRGAEQGTRNFVVFDENIPKILERNEQPIGGLLDK